MSTNSRIMEQILAQVEKLSPEERLRLIQRVAETLVPPEKPKQPQRLVYGQFKGERMSTEEDFLIAEWRPTEKDLDGS